MAATRVPAALRAFGSVLAIAAAAWMYFGGGFANYDAAYAIVWGDELVGGGLPDYDVALAPTPHPLATALGAVAALLGDGAFALFGTVAFLALGVLVWAVYRLGGVCYSWRVGVLAAIVVATSYSVLRRTGAAYVDVAVVALIVVAAGLEAERPRRGVAVLLIIGIAGLQRPEAWLLASAYLAYLWPGLDARRRVTACALAGAAPALWVLADTLVTGDPLYSFLGTREVAGALHAAQPALPTEIGSVPEEMVDGLRSILRLPVVLAGCAGAAIALAVFPRTSRVPAACLVLGIVASLGLGYLDLPVIDRFLFLPAAMLGIFFAVAALGWIDRPRVGRPWIRRGWMAAGIALTAGFATMLPAQADRLRDMRAGVRLQAEAVSDLRALADDPKLSALLSRCHPIYVQRMELVPLLAYVLDRSPRAVLPVTVERPVGGVLVIPDRRLVAANAFELGRPPRLRPPDGSTRVTGNRSWSVHAQGCGRGGA